MVRCAQCQIRWRPHFATTGFLQAGQKASASGQAVILCRSEFSAKYIRSPEARAVSGSIYGQKSNDAPVRQHTYRCALHRSKAHAPLR